MNVLVIATRKGGSGKSTLAAHLACCAVEAGERVVLIDTDPQASIADWGRRREAEEPVVVSTTLLRLPEALEAARLDNRTLAIVDTPGSFGVAEANAMGQADFILIPARPSPFDLQAIGKTLDAVRALRKPAAIVLTQIRQQGQDTAEMRTALAETGVDVLPEMIGVRVPFVNAIIGGLSVTEFERPDTPAVVEIRALYSALKGRLDARQVKARR